MTVPSWDKLPFEILKAIFDYVQNLDQLRQCQLTCKKWQKGIQSIVFKTIVLTKENDMKFINGVQDSPNRVNEDVQILYLCNKDGLPSWNSLEGNFSRLVSLCSKVKFITSNKMTSGLWLKLKEEIVKGNWQDLKRIPPPNDSEILESIEPYAQTALVCPVLETLDLYPFAQLGFNDQLPDNAVYSKKLVQNVKKFGYMKHLKINIRTAMNLYTLLESMLMIGDCPTLENLYVNSEFPFADRHTVDNIIQSFDNKLLSSVQPADNLKTFRGFIRMNDNSLQYFMRKFPNLKELDLNEQVEYPYSLVFIQLNKVSKDVQDSFFQYIAKLKSYELIFSFSDNDIENEADMISRYIHSVRTTRASLDQSLITIGKLTYHEDNYRFYGNSFKISSYPRPGSSDHQQGYVNVVDLNFFFSFSMGPDISQLLCKPLVDEVSKNVDEFHFSGRLQDIPAKESVQYDIELRDVFKWYIGECVKNSIKDCSLLKTLKLGSIEVVDNYSTNQSINAFVLEYCDIMSSQALAKLIARLPALKHLTLIGYTGNTLRRRRVSSPPPRLIVIDMPDTSLETITWKDGYYSSRHHSLPVINLKLSTCTGDKYYIFNNSGASESNESEFINSIQAGPITAGSRPDRSLDIKCHSLKTFRRKFINSARAASS